MTVQKLTTPSPCIDVVSLIPELAKRATETARLHPRRVSEDLPAAASKFGGQFYWPKSEAWPICSKHNEPFVGIVQLRKSESSMLPFLPEKDLFQLLWCPRRGHRKRYDLSTLAIWRDTRGSIALLETVPGPRDPNDDLMIIPRPCSVSPELVVEYPRFPEVEGPGWVFVVASAEVARRLRSFDINSISDIRRRLAEDEGVVPREHFVEELYWNELSLCPSSKIGGYVRWIQEPAIPKCDCGLDMEHLLTISGTEFDRENFRRWMPLEDRRRLVPEGALTFERVAEDGDEWWRLQHPTDILPGVGNIYVFVCKQCEHRPVKCVEQS